MIARVPSDRNRNARLGSASSCSSRRNSPKSCSTTVAPADCRITVLPEATLTLRPSSSWSSSAAGGEQVDRVQPHGLLGGDRAALADGVDGEAGVAAALGGDGLGEGGGVVDDLVGDLAAL